MVRAAVLDSALVVTQQAGIRIFCVVLLARTGGPEKTEDLSLTDSKRNRRPERAPSPEEDR